MITPHKSEIEKGVIIKKICKKRISGADMKEEKEKCPHQPGLTSGH